jgi:hypothetical protein
VRAETPTYLVHDRRLNVGAPPLGLDGHPRSDHIADHERPSNIDASVARAARNNNVLEADLSQEATDQTLEMGWRHVQQPLVKLAPSQLVLLLNIRRDSPLNLGSEPNQPARVADKALGFARACRRATSTPTCALRVAAGVRPRV